MPYHHRLKIGEQLGELAQRRIDHRAVLFAFNGDHQHFAIGKANRILRPRHGHAREHHFANLHLGGDDHVDGQMLAGEKIRPMLFEVRLRPHPGHLGRHIENGMGHLTGHHIDLIIKRDGDDHVRLVRSGPCQYIRVSPMAHIAAHIQIVANGRDQRRAIVDNGHIILFRGQMLGDAKSHLTCTADHHFHSRMLTSLLPHPNGVAFIDPRSDRSVRNARKALWSTRFMAQIAPFQN